MRARSSVVTMSQQVLRLSTITGRVVFKMDEVLLWKSSRLRTHTRVVVAIIQQRNTPIQDQSASTEQSVPGIQPISPLYWYDCSRPPENKLLTFTKRMRMFSHTVNSVRTASFENESEFPISSPPSAQASSMNKQPKHSNSVCCL